jgi:hypothetical protein
MPSRPTFWNVVNAVIGALVGLISAGTGLYVALKDEPPQVVTASVTDVANTAGTSSLPTHTVYQRTPWVGVELRQNGQQLRLDSQGDLWHRFEARLGTGPFEILISREADDPNIGIIAWHDDSIFNCVQDEILHLPGTGMAGGRFAVPILYLNQEGFNYYDNERLKRLDEGKYSIFVSTVGTGELELPLERFGGPLYLIIFREPPEFQMEVPRQDYELFTLVRK